MQDGLTWIKGNHTLKFGVELRDNLYSFNGCFACSGNISFNTRLTGNPQQLGGTGSGFASFLTGAAAGASANDNVGVSYKSWSQAFYVQDDWKATSRLTLNLGLRYDYQQWLGERNNGVSNLNVNEVNPENGLLGKLEFAGIDFERTLHAPDRNDFGPRFGFAFDLFGTGKTVIRGGYGLYYSLQGTVRGNRFAALGYRGNVTAYLPPGGNSDVPAFYLRDGFPFAPKKPLGNKIGPSAFQSSNHTTMEWETRNPYSQQFTFTLQQQVPGEMLFEAGYVGNKGSKIDSGNTITTSSIRSTSPSAGHCRTGSRIPTPASFPGRSARHGSSAASCCARFRTTTAFRCSARTWAVPSTTDSWPIWRSATPAASRSSPPTRSAS